MQTCMAQLMPLPLTVSCFSKIHIGFAFLVPAHPGSPRKRAVKWMCVCVCVCVCVLVDCLPSPVYKSSVWTSKEEYETSHERTEGMGRTNPATTARKTSSSDQSEYGRMPCDSSSQATTAKLQTSDAGEKQRRRRTSGAHQRTSRRPHRCRTVRQNCAGYRARCSPKEKWGDA